jgi:ribonuclease HI
MKKIIIHTDGSHLKKDPNAVTYGIVFQSGDDIKTASGSLDVPEFRRLYGSMVSNPTAELYATAKALEIIRDLKNADINFYADYMGVSMWLKGEWLINKDYIRDIVAHAAVKIKKLESQGCSVTFNWIKGHNGDPLNELADLMCRKSTHDDISEYLMNVILSESPNLKEHE